MAKRRMILYFGSFNPVHKGHIAMAEHVMDKDLGDEVAMIVSPQNPFKAEWMQAPEMDRLEMVERACRNSRHPDRIHPSVIEFLLEKPSYTVNTLRHLEQNYGSQMTFSILMGSDLVNQLPRWRDADEIISRYDLLVYPRPNEPVRFSTPRTTVPVSSWLLIAAPVLRRGCGRGRRRGLLHPPYRRHALPPGFFAVHRNDQLHRIGGIAAHGKGNGLLPRGQNRLVKHVVHAV